MLRYRYVPKRSSVVDDDVGVPKCPPTNDDDVGNSKESKRNSIDLAAEAPVGARTKQKLCDDKLIDTFRCQTHNEAVTKVTEVSNMNQHHPKRRKKRPVHGIKTVDVIRGRSGYGFTISGQHPCVLSCIVSGSPAEMVGLKPGDYIVAVNGENVAKASHDDVVRIVGLSTGTIELQVAENYNSSDSSDDDYPPRTKSRYPNRIRSRHHGHGERGIKDKYQFADMLRNGGHLHSYGELRASNSRNRHHTPVGAESELSHSQSQSSSFTSQEPTNSSVNTASFNNFSTDDRTRQSQLQDSKSSLNSQNGLCCSSTSVQFQELQNSQEMSGLVRHCSDNHLQKASAENCDKQDLIKHATVSRPASCSNLQGASAMPVIPGSPADPDDDDSFEINISGDIKSVVGYVGSIEMPGNANRPHQRLQSLRNAVRRLRKEQKIHTLVLMEVGEDGVKLTNAMGCTLAHYPVERLVFSGICPDDKRFFGIVTLHSSADDVSEISQQYADHSVASSCHIFMVDPELRSHNMHAQKANSFNIQCTVNPETQRCREFPRSATAIILSVANLYKDRPQAGYDNDIVQSQAFADPARAVQRSSSNSSNSDSGLGFGKEDRANEQVFVVEMPLENRQHSNKSNSEVSPAFPLQAAEEHPHLSPEVPTLPTPRNSAFNRPRSAFEMRRGINCSKDDYWQGNKLNPRAVADCYKVSNIWRARSSDDLDKVNSAENLRQSMHRLMQARQRHKSEQTLSSDSESQTSSHSDFTPTNKHNFSLQRPLSAPFSQLSQMHSISDKVETVDMAVDKLSPRVFFRPPNPILRSPSAPPISYFQQDDDSDDSDEEEDPMVRGIISRLNRDKTFGMIGEDPRRYSEGFILAKKREKEKASLEAVQKWTKRGSFRHQRNMKIQPPISQSHESLIEPDVTSKLINATSVNNIASRGREEKREVGRVAGWAVSFDKLLHDYGGVAVFTEFLKKEFSEENIIFWQACADYKNLTNDDQKKHKAKEIYNKHLSVKAPDPVNVDSASRQQAEKYLGNPTSIMFDMAQMHILQLMKQDSYVRFLKSDLYKIYLMREMEGQPLSLPQKEDMNIVVEKEKSKSGKGKENEKRRRSLLPWRQNKNKQSLKAASDSELKLLGKDVKRSGKEVNNNSKKPPGPGIDLSTMRKEVFQTKEEMRDVNEGQFKFCRVVLPDGSTTVVCAKPGQSIRAVLGKLCEKRGLSIAAVDVFMLGADKPLDLGDDVSTLGSKEVLIERRVLFRMDLPNKKSIGVKAKPNRSIRDVFKPILNKYGYRIDNIYVQLTGLDGYLDADTPVSDIDNQRVVIVPRDEISEWGGHDGASRHVSMVTPTQPPPLPAKLKYGNGNVMAAASLDELTNRIFDDLMKGKSEIAHGFDELGVCELDKQKRNHEEHRLSSLFGLLRKDSLGTRDHKQKAKVKTTTALPKTEAHFRKNSDDERLFELLSRAQNQRLDDQRGLITPTPEIPEFLRIEPQPCDDSVLVRCQSTGDLFDDVQYMQADDGHATRNTISHSVQHNESITNYTHSPHSESITNCTHSPHSEDNNYTHSPHSEDNNYTPQSENNTNYTHTPHSENNTNYTHTPHSENNTNYKHSSQSQDNTNYKHLSQSQDNTNYKHSSHSENNTNYKHSSHSENNTNYKHTPHSEQVMGFNTQKDDFRFSNHSFSSDGFFPSPDLADSYFQMRPVIVDTHNSDSEHLEMRLRKHLQQNGGIGSFDFHPRSTVSSGSNRGAPVASPEHFSPRRIISRHQWCESLDETLVNSPRYSLHERLSSTPPPVLHKSASAHKQTRTENFTPPPLIQNEFRDSYLQHVDSAQCKVKVSSRTMPVNMCNAENLDVNCTKEKFISKCVKSGTNVDLTPKVLREQHENGLKPVVLELSKKEELVTFV